MRIKDQSCDLCQTTNSDIAFGFANLKRMKPKLSDKCIARKYQPFLKFSSRSEASGGIELMSGIEDVTELP